MKKIVFRILSFAIAIGMLTAFTACKSQTNKDNKNNDDTIILYSSSEDFRNEFILKKLKEKFPSYDIRLEYYSTGDLAARLKAEGTDTECDIILELESSYLDMLGETACQLDGIVDFSIFEDNLVPENHRYIPWTKMSGCIIINRKGLEDKNLPIPTSYDDLTKPEYKNLISMPSPKSSGTGYIFLLNLVNERGEDAAFDYFDKLAENVIQFTSSGSGPMQAITSGEAQIALGMTFQAAQEIGKGADIEILFFEEGAPYTTYSSAIVEGRQNNDKVKEVFQYITNEISPLDKELYVPETIYKDKTFEMKNFPENIKYANMTGIFDIELKEKLQDRWTH
ncbi:MAG: extracellular solute-binding protein [Clostridiales bacterium]|nr:extracellular solute-binding protein [Clostridiales bacterium]